MRETIEGTVERVTFHSAESGFCVLKVKGTKNQRPFSVVGHLPDVVPGAHVDAIGEWTIDQQHGRQFRADELRASRPTTLEGASKYLGSGMVKGIGPQLAERLIGEFGEKVFDVIEKEPERLRGVPGIGEERARRIVEAWEDQQAVREVMIFLHSHGLGTARANRIVKKYGAEALQLVRRNPYRLAREIDGIGFRSADRIAMSLGILPDSSLRAAAALLFSLKELATEGHAAARRDDWIERSARVVERLPSELEESSLEVVESGEVSVDQIGDDTFVYLTPLFHAERGIARHLVRLATAPRAMSAIDAPKAVTWIQSKLSVELAASQRLALERTLQSKVVVITGGPGVGKTTIIRSLVAILEAKRLTCRLCAPTGRATRRLAEATACEAKTIHRLLEYRPPRGFVHNEDRQLTGDVFVLDEASMVDTKLMHSFLRAIPNHASVVIVGDVDQLPSVGPGQVLKDIIESRAVPVIRLTEIFRQSAQSRIVSNAHRIHAGDLPETTYEPEELGDFYFVEADEPEVAVDKICKLTKERIPNRFGFDPIDDIQVLTPMKRSALGSEALNHTLQALLNPSSGPEISRYGWRFRAGDKVMQIRNNYDKEVFNGDVGRIVFVNDSDRMLRVNFDGRTVEYRASDLDELTLAYACSVHKSQGSEYPAVVIPVHTQHYMMLHRNVLYTGVTRARKLLILVGSRRALSLAVERESQAQRLTGLRERLNRAATRTRWAAPAPEGGPSEC